jgi:hypothetical protein
MAHANSSTYFKTGNGSIIGRFDHSETSVLFEYSTNLDEAGWGFDHKDQLPHLIWTLDGFRYGMVKKTVAYIATDEQPDGQPVLEKWSIKSHHKYDGNGGSYKA